jgi:vacuolar-type H+-ATPase subunit B/Vma2
MWGTDLWLPVELYANDNILKQIKFPRYNEIVSLTLPDGSERSGQVLYSAPAQQRGFLFVYIASQLSYS